MPYTPITVVDPLDLTPFILVEGDRKALITKTNGRDVALQNWTAEFMTAVTSINAIAQELIDTQVNDLAAIVAFRSELNYVVATGGMSSASLASLADSIASIVDTTGGLTIGSIPTLIENLYAPKWSYLTAGNLALLSSGDRVRGSNNEVYELSGDAKGFDHGVVADNTARDTITAAHGDTVYVTGGGYYYRNTVADPDEWTGWDGTAAIPANRSLDPAGDVTSWTLERPPQFATYALALASSISAPFITTACHTDLLSGGSARYKKTGTTGTAGTGNAGLFYNAAGIGYELFSTVECTIEQFGITGKASSATIGDHVDESAPLVAAMTYAAVKGIGIVDESEKWIATTTWYIVNGLKYLNLKSTLRGFGLQTTGIVRMSTHFTDAGGVTTGTRLEDCTISVNIDCQDRDYYGIWGDSPKNCIVEKCHISGLTVANGSAGIYLHKLVEECVIRHNTIVSEIDSAGGSGAVICIRVNGKYIEYGGYFANSGDASEPIIAASGNEIHDNHTSGGAVGIGMTGFVDGNIHHNDFYGPAHRGLYFQGSCHRNKVGFNIIREYYSSAMLCGYASTDNEFFDNDIVKIGTVFSVSGEAAINIQLGCTGAKVLRNRINARNYMGVYIGPGCSDALVKDNVIAGYTIAGVSIESDWIRPIASDATYNRYDYAAPDFGTLYAYKDLERVTLTGNVIGKGHRPSPSDPLAAVAVTQSGTAQSITGLSIIDTAVTDDGDGDHALHISQETANKIQGKRITGFRCDTVDPAKIYGTTNYSLMFPTLTNNDLITSSVRTFSTNVDQFLTGDRRDLIKVVASAGLGTYGASNTQNLVNGNTTADETNAWTPLNNGIPVAGETIEIIFIGKRASLRGFTDASAAAFFGGTWKVEGVLDGVKTTLIASVESIANLDWVWTNKEAFDSWLLTGLSGTTNFNNYNTEWIILEHV